MQPISFLILVSVFSDCVVFYGDTVYGQKNAYRTCISLLLHPAAVMLSSNVLVYAIAETFIVLSVSLLPF